MSTPQVRGRRAGCGRTPISRWLSCCAPCAKALGLSQAFLSRMDGVTRHPEVESSLWHIVLTAPDVIRLDRSIGHNLSRPGDRHSFAEEVWGQWPMKGAISRAATDGRFVSPSSASAAVMARRPAFTPSQRSGSGSHRRDRCPTQGSTVSGVD